MVGGNGTMAKKSQALKYIKFLKSIRILNNIRKNPLTMEFTQSAYKLPLALYIYCYLNIKGTQT